MAKRLVSGTEIEKQLPPPSLTPSQKRTLLIGEYLYKYAIIDRNRTVDQELIGIFVEALDDLDDKDLERGLKAYLKEGERFPWPRHIRELSEL